MRQFWLFATFRFIPRKILQILFVSVVMFSFNFGAVWAQEPVIEPQKVIMIGMNQCGGQDWPITIEVWNVGAAGGEAYAQALMKGQNCVNGRLEDPDFDALYGTFTGGPNGIITFDFCFDRDDPTNCKTLNYQFVNEGKQLEYEGTLTGYIVQNPEAFDAWKAEPITTEYIYRTYGIEVHDTFGDDKWEPSSWSSQELILLNDVLKELPPGMLKKMAVSKIIRSKARIDDDGNQDTRVNGTYYPCGSPEEEDCGSSSGAIRIFDNASDFISSEFTDDPYGHKKFKGVILHELTHAMQYRRDELTIYNGKRDNFASLYNIFTSPLVSNYRDAIRTITDINDFRFNYYDNGWYYGHFTGDPSPKWHLVNPAEKAPTNYGMTNPLEDMCDSAMLYVYEPEKLKASSIKRYNAIRDLVFEGVEYENGIQKKP